MRTDASTFGLLSYHSSRATPKASQGSYRSVIVRPFPLVAGITDKKKPVSPPSQTAGVHNQSSNHKIPANR
jgi:hypothetical protein